jgi:endonuclease G
MPPYRLRVAIPVVICFTLVSAAGCSGVDGGSEEQLATSALSLATSEGFETGAKTAYAAGDVTLASGVWNFDDALIGGTTSDVKDGAKAARVRNGGKVTMGFDRAGGAGTVSIRHATYGADADGSWGLYYSQDQGASWSQAGGAIGTASGALATSSIAVNRAGPLRLQLRKLDGGSNRIDLDDIAISDYAGGAPDGGTTSPDSGHTGGTSGAKLSVHTTLGIPAPASTTSLTSYLSVKTQYVVSYNSNRKVPNWVSWELNTSYLGSQARLNDFRTDDTLPAGMAQATLSDYSGSGYDRGHMCPSSDRTASAAANAQTFYLTNMVPQAGNNNTGPWEKLETYSRSLATEGKELFVVSGGVFGASPKTIGAGVAVPSATFKVIAVLAHTGLGAASVTESTRVIGVVMPNDDSKISAADDWKSYRVTVRAIETMTGFDFLSDVDSSVQDVVESRVDTL